MKITAEFITSATGANDLPADGLPEIALVGRSNVGKSSLINALLRQRIARTSAAPGKTRQANVYRVQRGTSAPFHLVDLPGYGYARGKEESAAAFEKLTAAYFWRGTQDRALPARHGPPGHLSALLLVDARHPGLPNDIEAWRWLTSTLERCAIVGTKIDKLARGQRIRALREIESVFEESVLPVSAVTGEGLDELWKLIDKLVSSRNNPINPRNMPRIHPRATAPRHLKK